MYGVDLHRARVSPLLLRKHLPTSLGAESQTSRATVNNNNNHSNNHHHHHAYHHHQQQQHNHNQSQQQNHRHSHPIPATANSEHQDAPRRHTLTRGAVLLSGHSIRKSIRRFPRMVAQLTTGGRMGAYGASMNASDEFIVSKGTCSDSPQGKQSDQSRRGDGNAKIEDLVEGFGNGVSASELLIPLCMVSSSFLVLFVFNSFLVNVIVLCNTFVFCLRISTECRVIMLIMLFRVCFVLFCCVLFWCRHLWTAVPFP